MHEKGADLSAILKQVGRLSLGAIDKYYLKESYRILDKYL